VSDVKGGQAGGALLLGREKEIRGKTGRVGYGKTVSVTSLCTSYEGVIKPVSDCW